MRLYDVLWNDEFVSKIEGKHGVSTDEVEEVLFSRPHVRRAEKGKVKGTFMWPTGARRRADIWWFFSSANLAQLPCRFLPVK